VDDSQRIQGFHDDYAAVCNAFISVYECTFDESWLEQVEKLTQYVLDHFDDEQKHHFFYTDSNGPQLVARKKEIFDNVIPASNSMMAHALHRLGALISKPSLSERAKRMTEGMGEVMASNPDYLTHWASMAINIAIPTIEIATTGPNYLSHSNKLNRSFYTNSVIAGANKDSQLLLLKNRISDSDSIYICENGVCHLPAQSIEDAEAQIKAIRDL